MSYENHQALSGLTLGKSTDYRDTYDASLLQGVPRSLNRDPLGLRADALPFVGGDIWTLYELSRLNARGLPQVAVGRLSWIMPALTRWNPKASSCISTVLIRPNSPARKRFSTRWSVIYAPAPGAT